MPKQVLAVDDSRTIREMVSFTLGNAGYAVTTAPDGSQGLSLAKSQKFDCIITDLNMPGLDGISFTRSVRGHSTNRTTPILLLTTEGAPEKKQEGKAAGATGWLVKPFNPDKLIEVVRKVSP